MIEIAAILDKLRFWSGNPRNRQGRGFRRGTSAQASLRETSLGGGCRFFLFIALLIFPAFMDRGLPPLGGSELVSFQLENPEFAEMPEQPILRPVRQVRYAQPYLVTPHREKPVLLSLPGFDEELTQKFIDQYSKRGGIAWLSSIMQRGAPYLGFIRQEIERRNLPRELVYLPVIESAYQPNAVSRSGATGLWQFMRNSIAPFDIRVTEWMDERMDFWKSTMGALSKLEENYRYLGDWNLALAAYNAGLGSDVLGSKKLSIRWNFRQSAPGRISE